MNELLPEGELLPEETHFKLETLLRAKFLVEATNLISEVKTPWLSISRSSKPANMMLLQHHKKSFSMGKGSSAAASILAEASILALPSMPGLCSTSSTSWGRLELDPCSHLSQDRLLSPARAPNIPSPAGPRPPADLPAEASALHPFCQQPPDSSCQYFSHSPSHSSEHLAISPQVPSSSTDCTFTPGFSSFCCISRVTWVPGTAEGAWERLPDFPWESQEELSPFFPREMLEL